jgi:hypothetical protein
MATEQQSRNGDNSESDKPRLDRDDDAHDFVDQSNLDFDPDDGLYSGTAIDGTSEIAGPHIDAETGELTGMDEVREEAEKMRQDQAEQQR